MPVQDLLVLSMDGSNESWKRLQSLDVGAGATFVLQPGKATKTTSLDLRFRVLV